MKVDSFILVIKELKIKSIKNQMYELAKIVRDIERELSYNYTFENEFPVSHFMDLLQKCLIVLPEEQKLILLPIIRELKLSQLDI